MIYLVEGHPTLDRVEAESWDAAEAKLNGEGAIYGELVHEQRRSAGMEVKLATGPSDTRTVAGYGAVFGNVDSYGDVIAPGAFEKSLAAHKAAGTMPVMLLSHNPDALPVGIWTSMSEDGYGLKVEGQLLDTTAGMDTYKALKAGAINGLSIGFRTIEYALRSAPEDPKRTLKTLDLMEVSIVGFPANGKARVTGVKAAEEVKTMRDFEAFLRDAGGFSNAQAKAIAARGFKAIDAGRDDGGDLSEMADALRRNVSLLKF